MFEERNTDRRQSYSFKQHFHRAVRAKGFRRVVAPMLATAVVAGVSFANCSSDRITGPSSSRATSATSPLSPTSSPSTSIASAGASGAIVTKVPFAIEEFPIQVTTSCGGDVLNVTYSKLNASGTITIAPTGGFHLQAHLNQSFKAEGMTLIPKRFYTGSQDYDHETNIAGNAIDRMDFEMHVIARGEGETLFPGDDLIYHTNVEIQINETAGLPPAVVPVKAHTFTKCQ